MRLCTRALLFLCFALSIALHASAFGPPEMDEAAAQTARWLVHNSSWGVLTTLKGGVPDAEVFSFADGDILSEDLSVRSTGRLFFYVMGQPDESNVTLDLHDSPRRASLTISEAAIDGTCGFAASKVDAEDPRCTKLSITGIFKKVSADDVATGKSALFSRHPQMKKWPANHHFRVYELVDLTDIWMIDTYGGGAIIDRTLYYSSAPVHNLPWQRRGQLPAPSIPEDKEERLKELALGDNTTQLGHMPPWNERVARARWLVARSTWGVLSTVSVRLDGAPWGNVRSISDGLAAESSATGVPVMYLPTPDPSFQDVAANQQCALTLSEAQLPERRNEKGVCGGADEEDPTCARVVLRGRLRALDEEEEVARAKAELGARHPLAPWLAKGGAHTGGKYFALDLESVSLLDYYGGFNELRVEEYLSYQLPSTSASSATL